MARQRGNRWQADVEIDGVRKRTSFATQAEAEAYERAVDKGVTDLSIVTLGPFIDTYFNKLWGKTKAPWAPRLNCDVILRHIPATTPLRDINTRMIEDMVDEMEQQGKAGGTINRKLSALSKVLKLAHYLEVIDRVPAMRLQQEGKGRDRVLSPEEERKALLYLEHIGCELSAALVTFLLATGCRLGEAYKLTADDVSATQITFRDTKNGSTRIIPLIPKAKAAWATIKLRGGNMEHPLDVLPTKTFRGHWDRMCIHMGTQDEDAFVPHMLRHTCCTRLVRDGIDLAKVMKWMGHRNIQTTMRYSHLVPDDLDAAAKALSGY